LKKLNCVFLAIYGAEPLEDFEKLPGFVKYAKKLDFDMTLITSGHSSNVYAKLKKLYDSGLRSLTTSYDIVELDKSSKIKSNIAFELLNYFGKLGPVDNLAIVITLTKQNYKLLYKTACEMTSRGIWTFFDIIHPDRGQPGSKSRGKDSSLLFTKEDLPKLVEQLELMREAKNRLMIHASSKFFDFLISNPHTLLSYDWNCADYNYFPSWVTVNCDGLVYPCDDFQIASMGIPITQLYEKWNEIEFLWKEKTKTLCPGCCWNTHIDAHHIKEGLVRITEYVHRKV
jgi:MoaA/NifB/PqqE/SkfB family radical SAM enzyme